MSVKIMGMVFDADLPRDEKYVLLSYADHAAHDGTGIYPAIERMAWKTGYSTRSIQTITRKLVERNILVDDGRGPSNVNRWRIDVAMLPQRPAYHSTKGANSAPCKKQHEGVQISTSRGAEFAPNPSCNHHESSVISANADSYPAEKKSTQKKASKKSENSKSLYHIAIALAEICVMDYESNKGRLFAEAKRLSKAKPMPTPELIRTHYGQNGTWYTTDWRGKRGDLPTPGQIRSTWLQLAALRRSSHPTSLGLDAPSPIPQI